MRRDTSAWNGNTSTPLHRPQAAASSGAGRVRAQHSDRARVQGLASRPGVRWAPGARPAETGAGEPHHGAHRHAPGVRRCRRGAPGGKESPMGWRGGGAVEVRVSGGQVESVPLLELDPRRLGARRRHRARTQAQDRQEQGHGGRHYAAAASHGGLRAAPERPQKLLSCDIPRRPARSLLRACLAQQLRRPMRLLCRPPRRRWRRRPARSCRPARRPSRRGGAPPPAPQPRWRQPRRRGGRPRRRHLRGCDDRGLPNRGRSLR